MAVTPLFGMVAVVCFVIAARSYETDMRSASVHVDAEPRNHVTGAAGAPA